MEIRSTAKSFSLEISSKIILFLGYVANIFLIKKTFVLLKLNLLFIAILAYQIS